jgi:hypothetical protein
MKSVGECRGAGKVDRVESKERKGEGWSIERRRLL